MRLKFVYKQLGSDLSPQSCLYFQSYRGSKSVNGCLVVWPSNLCLWGIQWFSEFKIDIFDQWFQSKILLFCQFNSYFTFSRKDKLHFSLTCNFYRCLVNEGWHLKVAWQFVIPGLVTYKPVAYKQYIYRLITTN